MGQENPSLIWRNGALVPYADATVHVGVPALHFGPAVFEGIRAYALPDGRSNLFRLDAHVRRLFESARAYGLEIPFSRESIEQACRDTVLGNAQIDAYVRPIAFAGGQGLGFGRPGNPTETHVLSFPWDNRHLVASQKRGIRVHVSSVARVQGHPTMSKAKASANYAAGLLAVREARGAGYDDALLLADGGVVAEGATSNVFAVFGDTLVTPSADLPILLGVTRDTLLVLASTLGVRVAERNFSVSEMLQADELLLCGTTSEVTPVCEVDGRRIGSGAPGELTRTLISALRDAIAGAGPERGWTHWLKGSTR